MGSQTRRLLIALLSLLTLVGGHIVNRRPDKALLFFSLLLLLALIGAIVLPVILFSSSLETDFGLSSAPLITGVVAGAILTLLLLCSAVVSYLDAGKASGQIPLTAASVVGGLFAAGIAALAIVYTYQIVSISLRYAQQTGLTASGDSDDLPAIKSAGNRPAGIFSSGSPFWNDVRYGFDWADDADLQELPAGDAYLVGRMTYRGEPAVGVSLFGIFNGVYKSATLTTDDQGRFVFRLPAGEWTLNRIHTESWNKRPATGTFTLVGSANPRLTAAYFHEGPEFPSQGLRLTAGASPDPIPELQIHVGDHIQITWPDHPQAPADTAADRIGWRAVAGAARYQVQIMSAHRRGSTTTYSPVFWSNTAATDLSLSGLRLHAVEPDTARDYQVRVYAFDDSGRLLTSSEDFAPGSRFQLVGQEILSVMDFPLLENADPESLSDEDIERMQREKKLLEAAEVLTTEEMPAAARQLLERLESHHLEQQQDRLAGLILVAEGRCDEARLHFEAVGKKWNRHCLPDFFKERCGQQ